MFPPYRRVCIFLYYKLLESRSTEYYTSPPQGTPAHPGTWGRTLFESWDLGLWPFLSWDLGPKPFLSCRMGWDLGPDPFFSTFGSWDLGLRPFLSWDLGPDPFLNLGPGTWGTLRGACIAILDGAPPVHAKGNGLAESAFFSSLIGTSREEKIANVVWQIS